MRHATIHLSVLSLLLAAPLAAQQEGGAPPPDVVGPVQVEQGQEEVETGFGPAGGAQPQGGTDYSSPTPNPWFERTRLDLGTVFDSAKASGSFSFVNPTADVQKLTNITGSCTCSKAVIRVGERVYELSNEPAANSLHRIEVTDDGETRERVTFVTVGAGEKGSIEVFMDMNGIQGPREASLDLQTSDGEVPQVRLQWRATGATYFVVDPANVNLNEMSWKDRKEFYFEIRSPLADDFEITGMENVPDKMKLEYTKETVDGKTVYKVNGVYGPGIDPAAAGGQVTFKTNVEDREVTVPITAFVKGPIEMQPGGFFSFGYVRAGTSKSKTIKIWPTDDFELKVTKLHFKTISIPAEFVELSWQPVKHTDEQSGTEHDAIEVKIALKENAPKKTVRGELVIELNHPAAPTKEILFNGFVR